MFFPALLLAASAIAVPGLGPTAVDYFLEKIDFRELARNGRWVGVTVNLWVEPNRRISRCSVGNFAGDEASAKSICPMLIGMRTGLPRDGEGRKTYAYVTVPIIAIAASSMQGTEKLRQEFFALPIEGDPDARLTLAGSSISADDYFEIVVAVDTGGAVTACGQRGKTRQDLGERACELAQGRTFVVRRADSGEPVPYVRNVKLISESSKP